MSGAKEESGKVKLISCDLDRWKPAEKRLPIKEDLLQFSLGSETNFNPDSDIKGVSRRALEWVLNPLTV